ncbi:MAG: acyl-CoA dehydrogenase family protein, partial [Bdellovibrionales bacterium]
MDLNMLFELFSEYSCAIMCGSIFLMVVFGYLGAPFVLWALAITALAAASGLVGTPLYVFIGVLLVFVIKPVRRMLVSSVVMGVMKKVLPQISDTEKTALEAGVVWVEKDLFSGKLDLGKLRKEPYPELTSEEQAFLDGPVEEACKMINDWEIWQKREMPPELWAFLKKEKFFGMIIPKSYGGLGFSALAHGAVVEKISSRSVVAGVSVMVPNSLGPAELLNHYGTQEQKDRLLPKLAIGEELPCFGLTEPQAGSDAGSVTSSGVVFKGEDGKLKLRVNWNK